METRHDVLAEPLLRVRRSAGTAALSRISLPEALAFLSAGEDIAFLALQAHQRHAWHAFLVQLAALALHHGDRETEPTDANSWRSLLLALGDGQAEPWCLVVEDLCKPAFFQPPVPEGTLDGFRTIGRCADDLDMLVTANNHFIKQSRMASPRPESYVFALTTLQTMDGFSGRQTYGIARMNGGLSNRPCLGLVPQEGDGSPFLMDLARMREARAETIDRLGYEHRSGLGLLWLLPWEGRKSEALQLSTLDPWFIEICRRARLQSTRGRILAMVRSTEAARIDPGNRKGNTGDHWTPIKRRDGSSLTIPASGFTYRKLQQILFEEDYERNHALHVTWAADNSYVLLARALVRGQGKTEGFHERRIPLGRGASRLMASRSGKEILGRRSAQFVQRAGDVQKRVLRVALCALLQPAREKLDLSDKRMKPYERVFDSAVDAMFFEELFSSADAAPHNALLAFERRLLAIVRGVYESAVRSVPLPSAGRLKAVARADGLFWGQARKHLRDALEAERQFSKEVEKQHVD